MTNNQHDFNKTFKTRDGFMHCDSVKIQDILQKLSETLDYPSPFFIYSKAQIVRNIDAYKTSLTESCVPYTLAYAVKANFNPTILSIVKEAGCFATTVSGNEILLAKSVGIEPRNIVYNGNGKGQKDIELAVASQCLINVDSGFDLQHILSVVKKTGQITRILFRLNPDIDSVSV